MRNLFLKAVHLFLILIIVLMSGCGMFRKVFKTREYSKQENQIKSTKDSSGLKIDKSVITIKEKIDTVLTTPEKVIKQDTYLSMDSLVNGLTAVKNDLIDVRLVFNPVTGILTTVATVKPQKVHAFTEKETVKHNDIQEQSTVKSTSDEKSKSVIDNSEIKKTPDLTWGYVIAGVLAIAAVSFIIWKRQV